MRSRPHLYACAHLANSGSLLLSVSNLTNLLAFAATGLSFGRFTALMALPWTTSSCSTGSPCGGTSEATSPGFRALGRLPAAPRYALTILTGDGRRLRRHVGDRRAARLRRVAGCCRPGRTGAEGAPDDVAADGRRDEPRIRAVRAGAGVIFDGVRANGLHGVLARAAGAGRHRLARLDRSGAAGRATGQRRQQHPGDPGVAATCRRFTAGRARRALRIYVGRTSRSSVHSPPCSGGGSCANPIIPWRRRSIGSAR